MHIKYLINGQFELLMEDSETNIVPRTGEHISVLKKQSKSAEDWFVPDHYLVNTVAYVFDADKTLDHVNVYLDQTNG